MAPPLRPLADRADLQQLKTLASLTTDETLDSTRRMMSLCEESKEAGIKTLVALDDQGEQLDRIQQGVIQIKEDMRQAQKNLDGMEQCCGMCTLPCKKSFGFKEDASTWKGEDEGIVVIKSQPQRVTNNMVAYGGYVGKITNDAREDEMDTNLGQVATMVDNLRNMAIDIGGEIETTNKQLDNLEKQVESNELQVNYANQRADKILKS